MVLGKASQGTPLSPYVQSGKLAIKGEHRDRVSTSGASSVIDSVNLEKALSSLSPGAPQWDYAIGWISSGTDSCCFVEVHPANTLQVEEIVRKKTSAAALLTQHAPKVMRLADQTRLRIGKPVWRWITTGAHVGIHANTPAARRLRQAGVSMPTRHVELR